MNRRKFLKSLGLVGAVAVVPPVMSGVNPPRPPDPEFLPPFSNYPADMTHGAFDDDWAVYPSMKRVCYVGWGDRWPIEDFYLGMLRKFNEAHLKGHGDVVRRVTSERIITFDNDWWVGKESDLRYLGVGCVGRYASQVSEYAGISTIGRIPKESIVQVERDGVLLKPWWGPGHLSILIRGGGKVRVFVDYHWAHSEFIVDELEPGMLWHFPLIISASQTNPSAFEHMELLRKWEEACM